VARDLEVEILQSNGHLFRTNNVGIIYKDDEYNRLSVCNTVRIQYRADLNNDNVTTHICKS